MTSWFALSVVQVWLVAAYCVALYRRLGLVGAALAASMVIVGSTAARRDAAREIAIPNAVAGHWLVLGFVLFVLLVFAILVGAALSLW